MNLEDSNLIEEEEKIQHRDNRNVRRLEINIDDEIAQDQLSNGLQDDDPMMIDEEEKEDSQGGSSDNEEWQQEEQPEEPVWEEIQEGWEPQWHSQFQLQSGLSEHFPQNIQNASEYFSLFYDEEVLNLIVEETNRYAEQFFEASPDQRNTKYYQSWSPCNVPKVKAYLAIIMHMGLSQFPRMEYHWNKSNLYNCTLCQNLMSKNDFFLLHGFLHFVNNRAANVQDKLYKVRGLFQLLTTRFQRYYIPGKVLTLDERMVKYTGRLSFLQYIKNKPNQYGIKMFILADASSGYVCNWEVYTGAQENNRGGGRAIHNVVLEMTQNYGNEGRVVCFDSFYTYLSVAESLSQIDIGCIGTLRKNRRNIPNIIKQPPNTMNRGQSIFRRKGNTVALVWKDRKYVRILTNLHGNQVDVVGRPNAVRDYNIWTRGVDLSNQLIANYHNQHKSIKWYKTLALSFLETSIANAYCLYKTRNPFTAKKHLNFREDLIFEFMQEYIDLRNLEISHLPNNRIIFGMHHIGIRDQRTCAICSTKTRKKTSTFYCVECNQNICILDCFHKLHTLLKIHKRNKSRNI